MDNGESMNYPLTVLIVLLLIIIVMFACHYLGPRASSWICSNREEKIGLSKTKLFHSNGYMLPSGSAFLLSNSGSFKRFDITEKEETEKSSDHHRQSNANNTTATTPFWNIPQRDIEIPPQPLRPAPEPGRSVTFKFNAVNEISSIEKDSSSGGEDIFVPCIAAQLAFKKTPISSHQPIKIEAPPPHPRLFSSMANATNGSAAIPRPTVRRNNFLRDKHENHVGNRHQLTRRNSSTNPFLCDVIEVITTVEGNNSDQTALESQKCNGKSALNGGSAQSENVNNKDLNPFMEQKNHNKSSPNDHIMLPMIHENKKDSNPIEGCESHDTNSESNMMNISFLNKSRQLTTRQQTATEKKFRGRSLSEAGWDWGRERSLRNLVTSPCRSSVNGMKKESALKTNPFNGGLAQKTKGPHMLQKTFSEDFLFRKLSISSLSSPPNNANANSNNENGTWSFGRSLLRQNSLLSLRRRNNSQSSLDSNGSVEELQRAISCDSVNSDSAFVCDLDQPYTQITGHLCVGLHYDNLCNEGFDLIVTIKEAKGLIFPFSVDSLDTFVRAYLVPDAPGAMQTQVVENSQTPYFDESFRFWLKKQNGRHSLWLHLYHNGDAHTLIGEAEMEIHEAPRTITTWIPLSDSRKRNAQWGELMFSLSYLPTAERLTIVVVKARNLKYDIGSNLNLVDSNINQSENPVEIQSVFVKVYLMNNERKIQKKRTSLKRRDRSIIFNESMIFSVPPQGLTTVQLRLTVFGVVDSSTVIPLGHVIAGSCATGKGLRHWHQMLSSLRKPVSMWHVLRRATNQPVFTGGAEAVVAALQSSSLHAKRNSII